MNAAGRALSVLGFLLLGVPGLLGVLLGEWLVYEAPNAKPVSARITSVSTDPDNSDRYADYEYTVNGRTCDGSVVASAFKHLEAGVRERVYVASEKLCLDSQDRAGLVASGLFVASFGAVWVVLAGIWTFDPQPPAQALSSAQRAVSR